MGTIEREPEVIDSLTSTSTIDALSANQGKVLNDKFVYEQLSFNNHAITRQSAFGAYYSATEVSIAKTGYAPIACTLTAWSNISASVTPYVYNNKVGFLSDLSQTPTLLGVTVLYIAV